MKDTDKDKTSLLTRWQVLVLILGLLLIGSMSIYGDTTSLARFIRGHARDGR